MLSPEGEWTLLMRLNGFFCFFAGMILNGTLLYLVIKRSPPGLTEYKKILLLPCIIDMIYLTFACAVNPVGHPLIHIMTIEGHASDQCRGDLLCNRPHRLFGTP